MEPDGPFVGSDFTDDDFAAICAVLCEAGTFDLTRYKEPCVKRRIATRIRELGLSGPRPYITLLRSDGAELQRLSAALTIHVSRFYRDPATFQALRRLLAERLPSATPLRLWSAGCAAGEEAFSLALLSAQEPISGAAVEILGTDVSPEVLERARTGLYDVSHLSDVPLAEQERFFIRQGRECRVVPQLHAMVRFARHDLLDEEAYPQADLILCRYVLIYFSAADQERVTRRFADALPVGGLLALGRTEALRDGAGNFAPCDAAERIYRRI